MKYLEHSGIKVSIEVNDILSCFYQNEIFKVLIIITVELK